MSDQTPDLVERLRDAHVSLLDIGGATERDVVAEAADEIERLRAENERLRRPVVLNTRFDTSLRGVS
jgi:hypothetical protein